MRHSPSFSHPIAPTTIASRDWFSACRRDCTSVMATWREAHSSHLLILERSTNQEVTPGHRLM